MVWPTRVRHRERKHAFEEALEEARLSPEDDLEIYLDAALSNPASAPAVGSLGDITVASGYVATASLARAYGGDDDPGDEPPEPPAAAARKLTALIAEAQHSPQELAKLRRRFAARHHPDAVVPELREEALAAMAEVNVAIDAALRRGKAR